MNKLIWGILLLWSASLFSQVDINATIEAKNLHQKLINLSLNTKSSQTIFGQQNAFGEGRGWRMEENVESPLPDSDVKKVFGKNPGLIGYDFDSIGNWNEIRIIDQMRQINERHGVITLSWHMKSVYDDHSGDGTAWDTTGMDVKEILNNPNIRKKFLANLDRLIAFSKKIGEIPIIFRPWHEHNYSWFWWGKNHCTKLEYKLLWQLTFNYLTGHGVHNFLYAYSPNFIEDDYLDRYPGNNYVDILGVDIYFKNQAMDIHSLGMFPMAEWRNDIFTLLNLAEKLNKIPAITEFGNEGVWYKNFWTDYFSWPIITKGLKDWSKQSGRQIPNRVISYSMVWRNSKDDPKHFFGPAPGHSDVDNFKLMNSTNAFLYLEDMN